MILRLKLYVIDLKEFDKSTETSSQMSSIDDELKSSIFSSQTPSIVDNNQHQSRDGSNNNESSSRSVSSVTASSYRIDSADERLEEGIRLKTVDLVVNDPNKPKFKAKSPYVSETAEILASQLQKANIRPLKYYPLPLLKTSIAQLVDLLNTGAATEHNNAELDYLLACLESHPEYMEELKEEQRKWNALIASRTDEWLAIMRSFVPPSIFSATKKELQTLGYSDSLAKRLLTKKCLWMVRMPRHDIAKLHIADLSGAYSFEGQGLDIVELGALYASCPEKFVSDGNLRKAMWRERMIKGLKEMLAQESADRLPAAKKRHPAYKDMEPLFGERLSLHERIPISSDGAFVTEKPAVGPMSAAAVAAICGGGSSSSGDSGDSGDLSGFGIGTAVTNPMFRGTAPSTQRSKSIAVAEAAAVVSAAASASAGSEDDTAENVRAKLHAALMRRKPPPLSPQQEQQPYACKDSDE